MKFKALWLFLLLRKNLLILSGTSRKQNRNNQKIQFIETSLVFLPVGR